MNPEAQSYHNLNIALGANYEALKKLKEKFGSWSKAWQKEKAGRPDSAPELDSQLILKEDADYPALLKEISWAPLGLYIKGSLPDHPRIAIVGTRKATPNGKALAKQLARELTLQGATVVSGLAMGIDEAAHQGAVEAGGQTMAVLATGLDRIYPAQNTNLAHKILDLGGALISEYPPESPSFPSNFVHRDRIISGLSLGVVVIEAPEKSGALITAKFATEQNREIMAVPGPANHANYSGSHQLIRDGAKLVTSAKEILDELNLEFAGVPAIKNTNATAEENIILNTIRELGWPASIDKISQITKMDIPKVNQIITLLTLRGILKE
ncbi:MAG: DNA-processing protein DprA [bacterium]|nr:DNA-processing protein DprA [bacterium]